MEPVRLGVGTEWLLDGRTFRVVRQISNDVFVAEDIKFRVPREFTKREILTSYAEGKLYFSVVGPVSDQASGSAPSKVVHDLTEEQQAVLQNRWIAIAPLADLDRQPTQDEFRERSDQLTAGGTRISPRTLRRWWRRVRSSMNWYSNAPTTVRMIT